MHFVMIGIIISLILRYIIAVLELNVEYLVIPIIAVALILSSPKSNIL
jgi:hypothetical protein